MTMTDNERIELQKLKTILSSKEPTLKNIKSTIDENTTDYRHNYNVLIQLIDSISTKEGEKEELKKWLLSRKYNNWTIQSHRSYSENYTTINSFYPTGYNGIIELEPQTLSTIPARTGHGKTAVMINLMLDAIEQHLTAIKENPAETKAPVLFLSLEMTAEQIGKRIITNRMRAAFQALKERESVKGNLPTNADKINLYDFMTAQDKLNAPKGNPNHADRHEQLEKRLRKNYEKIQAISEDSIENLKTAYNAALNRLAEYEEQGLYILTDTETVSRNIEGDYSTDGSRHIKDGVRDFLDNFPNSLVFIDYLQLMETNRSYSDSWQSIKSICNQLKETAQRNNQIIITGAQFNRDKFTHDFAYPSELELSKMREGADIEHISNTVFAVAKAEDKDAKIKYYWKILKRRDGENNYESYFYDDDLMYCTLTPTSKDAGNIRPPRAEAKQKKETETKPMFSEPKDTTTEGLKRHFTIQINIYFKEKFGAKSEEQRKYASRMIEPCIQYWNQFHNTEKAITEAYTIAKNEKIIL